MAQKILKSGGAYKFLNNYEIVDNLEVGFYSLNYNPITSEAFIEDRHSFQVPSKIYEDDPSFRKICINSYKASSKNTGIALIGDKGTGKSLTACLLAKEVNLPIKEVITIKQQNKNIQEID